MFVEGAAFCKLVFIKSAFLVTKMLVNANCFFK